MRTALILLLLAAPAGAECIGNRSPDNPGFRTLGGRMLADQGDGHEYGIEVLCSGHDRLIQFQVVESRTALGEAVWKTLDSKTIVLTKENEVLVDATCKWKGVEMDGVIGVGHVVKSKDVVKQAFLANPKTGKLESLPVAAVSCEEPDGENQQRTGMPPLAGMLTRLDHVKKGQHLRSQDAIVSARRSCRRR